MAETKEKPTKAEQSDKIPFPEDLLEWIEDCQLKHEVAGLSQQSEAKLGVNPQNGAVMGEPPRAVWAGDAFAPMWAGYPYTRGPEMVDEKGATYERGIRLIAPVQESPGGVPCWRVAEDPACQCGVFLNAEVYKP